jgi:hypothetical protein
MSEHFSSIKTAPSIYVDNDDGALRDCRFILCRFGESADLAIQAFWKEHGDGNFAVAPVFSYGNAPRPDLCTQQSLVTALQSATIEPGSMIEQQWRAVCEHHSVAWPRRLQPKAA